jgi:hypothetical protein
MPVAGNWQVLRTLINSMGKNGYGGSLSLFTTFPPVQRDSKEDTGHVVFVLIILKDSSMRCFFASLVLSTIDINI